MMMMIELANRVVEDVRKHPYWTGGDIDYFNDPTESRAIPDMVMIDGLTAHYLLQQGSDKAMVFLQIYQSNLTDTLFTRTNGNKKIVRQHKGRWFKPARTVTRWQDLAYAPIAIKSSATTYYGFRGIDRSRDITAMETQKEQNFWVLDNCYVDYRGQLIRDPKFFLHSGSNRFPVKALRFYNREGVCYAEEDAS